MINSSALGAKATLALLVAADGSQEIDLAEGGPVSVTEAVLNKLASAVGALGGVAFGVLANLACKSSRTRTRI